MAAPVSAGLSRREARHFGLAVGAAFVVLAGVLTWRGRITLATAFGALGAGLVLFGALLPVALIPVRRGWMAMAEAISRITTPIFMGVVYFAVLTPVGLVRRLAASNPFKPPRKTGSLWVSRRADSREPKNMEHQF